jgi:hypothetical protein
MGGLATGLPAVHFAASVLHGWLPARIAGGSTVRAAAAVIHEMLGQGISHVSVSITHDS